MPRLPPPSADAAAWTLLLEHLSRAEAKASVREHAGVLRAVAALSLGNVAREIERRQAVCVDRQVGLICEGEDAFPEALRCIPDAPVVLYYRGDADVLGGPAIAVVGARRASRFGLALAASLAETLAEAGAVVVSGLALGVDAAAHRGALAAGGRTIAVLGSGVDRVQPVSNVPLARDLLAQGGLLASEYPPGTPAAPFRFPERNRLIAGLSLGVVVVEASERSGSLITARYAAEQGREVMAVPGTPGLANTAGANRLLKQGAALVERAEDVLAALGRELPVGRALLDAGEGGGLTPELAGLLDCLDGRAQSLDDLTRRTGLSVEGCVVALTELELGGFVQRLADGYIRRPSRY